MKTRISERVISSNQKDKDFLGLTHCMLHIATQNSTQYKNRHHKHTMFLSSSNGLFTSALKEINGISTTFRNTITRHL